MTRLEKYLLSTARDVIAAETTNSRYFLIDNLRIRISDHISNDDSEFDLQIITPYNGGTLYTVMIPNSTKVLCWTCKQITEFVPALSLLKGMQTKSILNRATEDIKLPAIKKIEMAQSAPSNQEPTLSYKGLADSRLKIKNLNANLRNIVNRSKAVWNSSELEQLVTLMFMEFGKSVGMNEDFQIFCNCTSTTYKEILNIYKIVVVDNNCVPTINYLQQALTLVRG